MNTVPQIFSGTKGYTHVQAAFNPAQTHNTVLPIAQEYLRTGAIALATLIDIEGSAPYPVGAQMAVSHTGEFHGQITGGCAERAIADHAVQAIESGQNSVHRYGLDSPYFDIQLPCGSGIDVHFEVGMSRTQLNSVLQVLDQRRATSFKLELAGKPFEKIVTPQPTLVLAGQGPILVELARYAVLSGFNALVLVQNDETLGLCTEQHIKADLIRNICLDDLPSDEFTGLVSLFHEHELELPILERGVNQPYFYYGALGSRSTHAARLEALQVLGVSEPKRALIHGPVGLKMRANTPSQIAISIVAEAINELNGMLQKKYPQPQQQRAAG